MKIKLIGVFLFIISCFQAQEIIDKSIFKKCRKEFNKKICLSDEDKDGVLFYLDKCPKESGVLENKGCPWSDKDEDGVFDKDDECPEIKGLAEYKGCPIPDADGDGVLDYDDACPTTFGYKSKDPYKNGCMKDDCDKKFIEWENRLQRFIDESKNVNYDKLKDKIIKELNEKLLPNNDVVVFNDLQYYLCGTTGTDYYCKPHYNFLTPVFTTENFWDEETVLKIYDRLKKNIILAKKTLGEGSSVEFEKKPVINREYKYSKLTDLYKKENDVIVYTKLHHKEKHILKYSTLSIEISKNDLDNKIEVKTLYTENNSWYGRSFITIYQYIDNDWIIIENKEQKKN
ncbi:Thrombospondin type 3 repeat-containing protein [Chryseobacterium arachidis]|uniref:Thrombospondin type 3 repeat-containing protein n=1 Tax=Chryseobacterium arachidis TaxID=1416778 RepID=A0A1M5KAP4_9FLAO|nr:thrombospondin type 3 repeat-containing protein [Chryseobacterium arachidis]SHG49253.1 Thrombospondin type 3 repeat-containing protein [Chryseobacterium arachidis]